VLAVVVFHADPALLPGGFLGVDLFFVISGYLITRLLLNELGTTGRLDLARFYLRRLFRIVPALLILLLAVTLATTLVWRDELPTLRASVLSSLSFVNNWWLIDAHQSYFMASGRPPLLQHLWSLAVEEQFYLLWPVLLMLMSTRRRRFGWVATVAFGLAAASTTAMTVLSVKDGVPFAADSARVYFGTDTHSMGLLLGAMMGACAERLDFQPRRSWRIRPWATDLIGLAALVGLFVAAFRINEFSEALYRGGFAEISALGVLVVSTVTRARSRLGVMLDWRPLRWLGDRSYSIYLWHWPVVVVTRPGVDLPPNTALADVIRVVLPVLLASASYAVVERPLRSIGARWLERRRNPASMAAAGKYRRLISPKLIGVSALAGLTVAFAVGPVVQPPGIPGRLVVAASANPVASSANPSSSAAAASRPNTTTVPTWASVPTSVGAPLSANVPPSTNAPLSAAVPLSVNVSASPKSKPAAERRIIAYGDSVMLGAQSAIDAIFPHSQVHAVEGRQPYVTLQDIREDQANGSLSTVVAIHTGNNGIIRPSDLASTLSALRHCQQVVLLTDRVPRDWQAPNNATIKQVAKRFKNVVVLDWYAKSNENQGWFYPDGLHLRPPGAARYADLLAHVVAG
jgi:peptidoglycan/LPS O-acetylase OafA/YrhL